MIVLQVASLQNANSTYGMYNEYYQDLSELETMLQNSSNSVSTYINDAMAAIRDLNVDTSSVTGRSTYLNRLQTLCQRVNSISGQIEQQQLNINSSLQTIATTINQLTTQIAFVNQQIAVNVNQDNSSLMDQQEGLVQTLAQYMNFTRQTDANGQTTIMLSNGLQIVSGAQSTDITTAVSPANPGQIELQCQNGPTIFNVTSCINNGQIAGLYSTQASLAQAETGLNQLSLSIMDMMNKQNKLGIDAYGNLGDDIFVDINNANALIQRVIPNTNNTGSEDLTVSITDSSLIQASDYALAFNGGNYTLTRLSDNAVVSTGAVTAPPQDISVDGFSININSGTVASGDSFIISPTRGMSDAMALNIIDPNALALAWPVVASADLNNTGSGSVKVASIVDTTNTSFSIPQQLNPPLTIQFVSNTQFQLIDANTSTVIEGPIDYVPGQQPIGFAVFPTPGGYDPGYRVSLFGAIKSGDTFNLNYQSNSSGDNRNGLAMEDLYSGTPMNGGTQSYTGAYQLMANNVSGQTSQAGIAYNSSQTLQQQADANFAQVSGVSVEEEMSNLMIFQQAFAASAQVLSVAKNVFDIITSLGNR